MAELLEQAFHEASKLPKRQRDAMAKWLLQELASERRWDSLFASSQKELAQLGAKALAEYRKGRTRELDPEAL